MRGGYIPLNLKGGMIQVPPGSPQDFSPLSKLVLESEPALNATLKAFSVTPDCPHWSASGANAVSMATLLDLVKIMDTGMSQGTASDQKLKKFRKPDEKVEFVPA